MRRGDSSSAAYVKEAAFLARDRLLARTEGGELEEQRLPETDARTDLASRFRLDPLDRRLLDFLLGAARSLEAGRLLHQLSGRAEPTVELLRTLFGDEVEAALAPAGRLRAHGLCTVAGVSAGLPEPGAAVALAPGMAARLAGFAPTLDELGPGVEIKPPPEARPVLPDALAEAVREHMVALEPTWVTVAGARIGDAGLLADALAHRIARPVAVIDGKAIGGIAERWELLAALRRESDLADTPLIFHSAGALQGAWRALAAPRPEGGRPKPIVLLNLGGEAAAPSGFVSHAVVFVGREEIAAKSDEERPVDRLEAARHKAAIDAARALGKPIPGYDEPVRKAIPRLESGASTAPEGLAAAPTPPPAAPAAAPEPALAASALAATSAPAAVTTPAAPPPMPIAASLPEAEDAPPHRPERRVSKPMKAVEVAPPPDEYPPDPADDLPYLQLPAEPNLGDLVRAVYQTDNPKQKAEIMIKLAAGKKDTNVLKLLRAFATTTQPRVKAAAEYGLAKMFGGNYGAPKPIAPPVQPPRSDDD